MATTPSHGWSRSRPTSVPMSSIASRALAVTEFSVRENTTFGIGPLDPGVARKTRNAAAKNPLYALLDSAKDLALQDV